MREFTMTIDGEAVSGDDVFEVFDPATSDVVASAPDCSRDQLHAAMRAARRAFGAWSRDLPARREAMTACAEALLEAREEIAEVTTREQGMPLHASRMYVDRSAGVLRTYASLELPREIVGDDDEAFVEVVRRPVGVVAAIKPWNAPVGMAAGTIAPAFRAGCTVVLKPSPFTPLGTLLLGEVLRPLLPPGVINVLSGQDPLGQWMVEHPIPRAVSFTGSVATGKKVNVTAAADLKRVQLELGGNDPAIVLDDVDPEAVADMLFWRAFSNAGQICTAVKRVYVPSSIHGAVVAALARKAESVVIGNGMDEASEMGPVTSSQQFTRVSELVAEAVTHGATAVTGGGARDGAGHFYPPTILTDVAEGSRIVDEEQFGPALPVMPYDDIEDVIRRANDTTYGLGGSVWSADPDRARALAERLECGVAWVNTHGVMGPQVPMGGRKWSGLGVKNGVFGVYAFMDVQTVYRAKAPVPASGARS